MNKALKSCNGGQCSTYLCFSVSHVSNWNSSNDPSENKSAPHLHYCFNIDSICCCEAVNVRELESM